MAGSFLVLFPVGGGGLLVDLAAKMVVFDEREAMLVLSSEGATVTDLFDTEETDDGVGLSSEGAREMDLLDAEETDLGVGLEARGLPFPNLHGEQSFVSLGALIAGMVRCLLADYSVCN